MDLALQIVVFLHLVGFAALLGGGLVQLRDPEPEMNVAMLHGSWTGLVTGVALWVLDDPAPPTALLVVKLVLTAFVTVLVVRNRRYLSVPRGLLLLVVALVLLTAALSVVGRS